MQKSRGNELNLGTGFPPHTLHSIGLTIAALLSLVSLYSAYLYAPARNVGKAQCIALCYPRCPLRAIAARHRPRAAVLKGRVKA